MRHLLTFMPLLQTCRSRYDLMHPFHDVDARGGRCRQRAVCGRSPPRPPLSSPSLVSIGECLARQSAKGVLLSLRLPNGHDSHSQGVCTLLCQPHRHTAIHDHRASCHEARPIGKQEEGCLRNFLRGRHPLHWMKIRDELQRGRIPFPPLGVIVPPGNSALTRIPSIAWSDASDCTRPINPALDAA